MIREIGVIPTQKAQFDEHGNLVSEAVYGDSNYYVMSHDLIAGLTPVEPDRPLPRFASNTHYYAFADEADAKTQLNYDSETGEYNVEIVPPKEQRRLELKAERGSRLNAITHDFGDGRVVQVRPSDVGNFQLAINEGVEQDWVMKDNTVAALTVAEMQEALQSGIAQGKQVWAWYTTELKAL